LSGTSSKTKNKVPPMDSKQVWPVRADPRLRPLVEAAAAAELRKPSEMIRVLIVEGLERRGLMQRPELIADRTGGAE
jgi:hypothetical protein